MQTVPRCAGYNKGELFVVCGTICSGFHYFVFLNGMMWRCGWLIRLITNYCGAIDERKVHESMQSRYDDIMERGAAALQENAYTLDPYIHALSPLPDSRRGLTLIARLHGDVKSSILDFMKEVSLMEPDQYLHDPDSLHITVLSIISAREGYDMPSHIDRYVDIISSALKQTSSFSINFNGVTTSPGCTLAQGYPDSLQSSISLENMRNSLRDKLRASSAEHNMDARYPASTAHCSIIRYRAPIRNSDSLLQYLQMHRQRDFGCLHITELELVYNDWYLTPCNTQIVATFPLDRCE